MDLTFYERQHIQRLLRQENQVKRIFDEFIRNTGQILTGWRMGNRENVWIRNAGLEKRVEQELINLQKNLLANIDQNTADAWGLSNRKIDDLVKSYIEGLSVNENIQRGMFSHNEKAMQIFRSRKIGGKSVSARVWDVSQSAKDNIEFYLSSGLSTGRPSALISQDIRQLLNKPDKRFRRMRNESGKLVYSKPMADYHPGRGVYRSSYMNGMRLAVTQTNMLYRLADHERWNQLDFVLGINVQRSNSAKEPCPICDALKGKYPKGFVFPGWHPFCICVATPIMLNGEEFTDYLMTGEVAEGKFITNIPTSATKYINDHHDQFNKAPNKPIWIQDNQKYLSSESAPIPTPTFKPVYENIADIENNIRMNKSFETAVAFSKEGEIILDKRGEATSVSFTNEESSSLKDAILTHNHPRGWSHPDGSIGRIGNSFSKEDLMTAVSCDLAEIRAVSPNYTFVMKRPDKGWGVSKEKFSEIFNEEDRKLRNEFVTRINNDTLTPGQANATHFHILSKRISERLNWIYSKAKTR